MIPTGMGMNVLDINSYAHTPGTTPTKYPDSGAPPMNYIYPGIDAKFSPRSGDLEKGGDVEKMMVLPSSNSTSRTTSERGGQARSRPQSIQMTYAKSIVG
jgi:hypothetical protein